MQQFDEAVSSDEVTARSTRVIVDEPASTSTRVARLEGQMDLLAKDVRAVLAELGTKSKKLATARTLGAVAAGALAALAPQHAGQAGKLIEALLSLFGG